MIDKAIRTSDLGLESDETTVKSRGACLFRLPLKKRRRELVKHMHKVAGKSPHGGGATSGRDIKEAIDKLEKRQKKSARMNKSVSLDELEKPDPLRNERKIEDPRRGKGKRSNGDQVRQF